MNIFLVKKRIFVLKRMVWIKKRSMTKSFSDAKAQKNLLLINKR